MGFLAHMINGAQKATGDTVTTAGLFQRKGAESKVVVRDAAGLATGAAVDSDQMFNIGSAASMAADAASAGERGTGAAVQVALQGAAFVVALSESSIYILRPTKFRGIAREQLELLHTFPRHHVSVRSRSGALVRTLEIDDPQTGTRVELESERNWRSHGKQVISTLVAESMTTTGT